MLESRTPSLARRCSLVMCYQRVCTHHKVLFFTIERKPLQAYFFCFLLGRHNQALIGNIGLSEKFFLFNGHNKRFHLTF